MITGIMELATLAILLHSFFYMPWWFKVPDTPCCHIINNCSSAIATSFLFTKIFADLALFCRSGNVLTSLKSSSSLLQDLQNSLFWRKGKKNRFPSILARPLLILLLNLISVVSTQCNHVGGNTALDSILGFLWLWSAASWLRMAFNRASSPCWLPSLSRRRLPPRQPS